MLRLLIFDMDGTLVQTERLKARSYAEAAHRLAPAIAEADVERAYRDVVGRSRREVATALMHRFGLEEEGHAHMAGYGGSAPWEGFVGVRLDRYRAVLRDADTIRRAARREVVALVRRAEALACRAALATTSERWAVDLVLAALGLDGAFATIVTADDVAQTKPDPEAYRLVLDRLAVAPGEALALEDSDSGVQAALAAGVACLALPTALTRPGIERLVEEGALARQRVVENEGRLPEAVRAASG